MCELLGMECNVPTDIVFSFSGLALRGGKKGPHADGWGLALYEGNAARTFLEPSAASNSPLATYVKNNPIKTLLAIAHVRKKTRIQLAAVCRRLKEDALTRHIPVVLVTALDGRADRISGLEAGADEFLTAAYGAIHRGIAAAGAGYVEVARLTSERL